MVLKLIKISIIVAALICPLILVGQQNLKIEDWDVFLPYKSGKWVTQSDNHIIYSTDLSILLLDKEDISASFLSKVDGLSDTGIGLVKYDRFNDQLIVIYNNSNIDIISNGDVFNETSIKNNQNIIGSREVYDIHIGNRERMFFSTSFGILEYRAALREFGSTIFTNTPIYDLTSFQGKLLACTDEGLYMVDEAITPNINDFSRWRLLGEEAGLPALYEGVQVEVFNDGLYFSDGLALYFSGGGTESYEMIYEIDDNAYSVEFLSGGQEYLLVGLRAQGSSRLIYIDAEHNINEIPGGCIDRIRYAIEDEKGRFWYADNFREFRYMESPGSSCKRLDFNSPLTEKATDIAIGSDILVISSGGVTDNYLDLFSRDGYFIFKNGSWENINENNYSPIKDNDLLNFFKVELSPDESKVFLGTFWKGLLVYDHTTRDHVLFNENNSTLQQAIGDSRVRVSDLSFDQGGNLWITNFNAPEPLVLKTMEDEWYSFSVLGDNRVGDLTIDDAGNKWVVTLGTTNGVFIFNEGEDISSSSDDRVRWLSLNNSVIPTPVVFTVFKDLEGDIWVGTAEGVVTFERGQDIFNSEYRGLRKTVEVDSIGAYLLETEEVKAISADGANRKWFGTRNGIFVQSPDGEDQVARYTIDNSPLLDNEIIDLEFDGEDGMMYIATNKGVQVIRTPTTLGRSSHSSQVYAFPNPVHPDYNGPIAIKGLANDAIVKITDLSGRLIFETQALGGQAIWYGNDLSGNRANTGVYLVFSTGSTGFGESDSYVSKILFIE